MAHRYQMEFCRYVKNTYEDYFSDKKILEVGSLQLGGGGIRQLFNNCEYIGIDVGEGEGVDIACAGQDYDAPDESFDVTCSTECFEHNPFWRETFANMIRMTKPNGLVFMTCATTGRPEHGTTRTTPQHSPLTVKNMKWEYYRNLEESDFYDAYEESFDEIFEEYEFHSTLHPQKTAFMTDLLERYKEPLESERGSEEESKWEKWWKPHGLPYRFSNDLYFVGVKKV